MEIKWKEWLDKAANNGSAKAKKLLESLEILRNNSFNITDNK